jgi:hypothetical protein
VEELLSKLHTARLHASAGQMLEAQQNIDDSLELLEDAIAERRGPKPSARAVRAYIEQARFALGKTDNPGVASALDSAIRMLQEPAVAAD